jgi:putative phage-type endonuclease
MNMAVRIKDYNTKAEWLEARAGSVIGGSEVATLMGANPYCSPLELWQRKKGLIPELEESQAMYWGTRKEAIVADEWKRRHNRPFVRLRMPMAINSKFPWMIASPDRLVLPDGCREGLEIKAPGFMQRKFWGAEGSDEIPRAYFLQCHHYLTVFEFDVWHCATLIGGDDYRDYMLPYDKEISDAIIDASHEFADLLDKDDPPDDWQTYYEDWRTFLDGKWQQTSGDLLPVTDELAAQIEELRLAIQIAADHKLDIERLKTQLQTIIGEADGLSWEDEDGKARKITWKRPKVSTKVDWQAIAEALAGDKDIPKKLIAKHTTEKKNGRRFVTPRAWSEEAKGAKQ